MTTTPQPIVAAAFTDRGSAEQALTQLRNAGFRDDQIKYWVGASSGGFLETIKSAFSGQEGTSSNVYDDLTDQGVPENTASFFQREADAGRTIVAVLAADGIREATDILARYGGYGDRTGAAQTVDSTSAVGRAAQTAPQEVETEEARRLRLREEQLQVQKQPVETGEVRLRKDVVTEQKSIDVPVTHEEVYIERRPGSGQPAEQPIGEGETIRVPVREEQVTVEKQPVVREEVALGKRPVQETKQVSDTVRREEVHLERTGDVDVQGSDIQDLSNQTDQTTP